MAQKIKTVRRHISTDIDFELRSPVLRAVLTGLLIVLLLTVAVYQIYVRTKAKTILPTETALVSTVYNSVTAEAVVLRSETALQQTSNGTVVPMVSNGSKVAINDTVARVFSDPADAQNASAFAELEEQIDYYESVAALSSSNLVAGMEMYSGNVTNRLIDILNCADNGRLENIPELMMELSEGITKKQIAVGENVDVGPKLQALYAQVDQINGSPGSYSSVTAPAAGYYVNTADGYEDILDMSTVLSLTPSQADSLLNAVPVPISSGVGKLITEFNWYIVCSVDASSADMIDTGDTVKISVDELGGETIPMKLKAKNMGEDGRTALIFSSNIMNSEIAALRFTQIKIRTEEYTGYAVNKKAVRTVDGNVGVYIQLGNMIRFRKIDIIYSDDNVILADVKNDDGYLKLYDEIITEGVEHNDGKIIV